MSDAVQPFSALWQRLFPSPAPAPTSDQELDRALKASLCTTRDPAGTTLAAIPIAARDNFDGGARPPLTPVATSALTLAAPQAPAMQHGHMHMMSAPRPAVAPQGPLPELHPMGTIDLADGDHFTLDIHPVQRKVAGVDVTGISYGGSVPGPVLRVKQGSTVTVKLRNQTDSDTTLHSHGLRLDWRFDGVPHLDQDPVPPGGEFDYKLTFPDAGVYWYHPHIHDWAIRQQGAYGVFLVQPTDPNYYNPVNREEVLALQDLAVNDPSSHDGGHSAPTHVFAGMYGDTMLVNGQTDYALHVKKGDVVRFHILNAADARVFNLAFPGARVKVIGSDIGKNEREEWADSVMIAPAERYTVEVLFDTPGTHQIVSTTSDGTRVLGKVEVDSEPTSESHADVFNQLHENKDVQADIAKYRQYFDKPIDKRIVIDLETKKAPPPAPAPKTAWLHLPAFVRHAIADGIAKPIWARSDDVFWEDPAPPTNRKSNADNTIWKLIDPDTGNVNNDIQWTFNQGDITKIEIQGGPLQHPIHFHGERFLVLSTNGVPNPNLQWKDTVLVPAGEKAVILVDNSNPGKWMFHCHIGRHALDLDHPMHRMTGFFEVVPRKAAPSPPPSQAPAPASSQTPGPAPSPAPSQTPSPPADSDYPS